METLASGQQPQRTIADQFGEDYPEHRARAYIAGLQGNTSLLTFRYLSRVEAPPGSGDFRVFEEAHAIVAVRRDDGEIVYVDAQVVPPHLYRRLPPVTVTTTVHPTDVDWRYNRQIYAALRDGNISDSYY